MAGRVVSDYRNLTVSTEKTIYNQSRGEFDTYNLLE